MTSFKSWDKGQQPFQVKGGVISSKQSKPMDIRNYIRADRLYTRSDIRLKSDICDLNKDDLDKLNKLVPKSYKFKNDNKKHFGFIAQDLEKKQTGRQAKTCLTGQVLDRPGQLLFRSLTGLVQAIAGACL